MAMPSDLPASDLLASVIVPVFNGGSVIERCLNALIGQTISPERYEVIVVDDGSTDDTVLHVESWAAQHPECAVTLVRQANTGPGGARNLGARHARAELLLFTDADCAPLPEWMEHLLAPFCDGQVIGAKGTYVTGQRGLVPRFVQAEYEDRYDRMRGAEQIDFIDTYSAAYRRDVFLENGGFDPIFVGSCEDQEFSFRLAQKGYRMVFAPGARVSHIHDGDAREYFWRKYNIGFWKALLTRCHPERMVQDSHTPQVLKLQIVLLGALLALLPLALAGLLWHMLLWTWLGIALLFGVFIASAAPFLMKLAHRSFALAAVAPGLLAIRALALGGGYLVGTVHFAGTIPGSRQPVIPGWKRLIKRVLDVVGALLGLVVSIPFVAIAAIAIKLDSPGPVFYQQVRVGENGHPFRIVKLRSMVIDADRQLERLVDMAQLATEPAFKLSNDPRVTRVGRFLRRTSLDEVPQFYNVLRGDMSLVGPRPEEERIVQLYQDHHRKRLAVKPGMTGPMQVNGRGELSFSERLQLELDYIEHYSLRRDFEILLHTVPAMLRGHGAK
jgi:lipopolysaccharide/colanic/teichoic acid biosynthesis glycosyltransferase/GT2 family glycosyltransferase